MACLVGSKRSRDEAQLDGGAPPPTDRPSASVVHKKTVAALNKWRLIDPATESVDPMAVHTLVEDLLLSGLDVEEVELQMAAVGRHGMPPATAMSSGMDAHRQGGTKVPSSSTSTSPSAAKVGGTTESTMRLLKQILASRTLPFLSATLVLLFNQLCTRHQPHRHCRCQWFQ
jgi:hypothetical protein